MNPRAIAAEAVRTHGAVQKENELAGFLAVLADDPPAVVVEIGCDAGGTVWAWQQVGARRVLGVSLPGAAYASGAPLDDHGARIVEGDSHDPATLAALTDALAGDPVDLLFIDGDHTEAGVRRDFEMYAPLVRPTGIVAFHDICPHPYHPDVGVRDFWVTLGGDKDEVVSDPPTWGGIGYVRLGHARTARYVANPQLGSATELVAR